MKYEFRTGRKIFSIIGFAVGFFIGVIFGGEMSTEPTAPAGFTLFAGLAVGTIFLIPAFLIGWFKDYVDKDAWLVNEHNRKIASERRE